jgi:GTP:adenosylcobinamide-phosphate guanylyltransferase
MDVAVPAVVTAGDGRAAKAVHGESKVYLPVAGRPLVVHVVLALQRVPEVSEVWVVGNAARLRAALEAEEVRSALTKPVRVVPQFRNLYENAWQTYRRLLPGAGPEGRDPGPDDLDQRVLYLSGDLPFATPQEISEFVRRAWESQCDYALGLVTEASMEAFYPPAPGAPGIRMAYFNLREGRFRQSNLHLVRPARIGNRHYIEDMYEHRYQKEFGHIARLAWTLVRSEQGGLTVLAFYLLLQAASVAHRLGWGRLADFFRRLVPIGRVEDTCSGLLRTRFRFVATEIGGCAVDIDNEHDYDAALQRYPEWIAAQGERAERLYGPLLPASTGAAGRAS